MTHEATGAIVFNLQRSARAPNREARRLRVVVRRDGLTSRAPGSSDMRQPPSWSRDERSGRIVDDQNRGRGVAAVRTNVAVLGPCREASLVSNLTFNRLLIRPKRASTIVRAEVAPAVLLLAGAGACWSATALQLTKDHVIVNGFTCSDNQGIPLTWYWYKERTERTCYNVLDHSRCR